jgi:hypothetical protein
MLGRRCAAVVAVRDEGTHLLRGTAIGLRIDEAVLLRPTDVELTAAECADPTAVARPRCCGSSPAPCHCGDRRGPGRSRTDDSRRINAIQATS